MSSSVWGSKLDIASRSKISPVISVCTRQFTRSGVAVDAESLMLSFASFEVASVTVS